jgi:putative flippase GtrA
MQLQFIRFLVAGGVSVLANLASRVLLSYFIRYEVAIVLAHLVGMATAYLLMASFVFDKLERRTVKRLWRFTLVNLVSLLQTWLVSVGLVRIVFPLFDFDIAPELVGHIIGLGTTIMTSFWAHRRFSFAPGRF